MLLAQSVSDFIFEWYPVFGVLFSLGILVIFALLLRSTMGSTKPETVKASKTEPVLWDEVQGVDAAKEELVDVADWLKDPKRFESLGARAPAACCSTGPRDREDDASSGGRRPRGGGLLRRLRLELR